MRKRIAIDMDEVIADTLHHQIVRYNKEFGAALTLEQLVGKEMCDAVHADHRSLVASYPYQKGFFEDIPVVPHSQDVVLMLTEHYDVFVTTAAMEYPNSFMEKFEWLGRHFPFIPWSHIVFCGDKGIIAADYMIDDNAYHFEHFAGEGILFTAPHNVHEARYRRVDDWMQVRDLFLP
ncbi:MAG TPA: hypothetical protein VFG50_03945 [Rhodothermales bacterium]|nr:hypothetical protein [Rhodothermales bacterium]